MPEHFHLLVTEPRSGKLSVAMQVLKERVSRRFRRKRKNAAQLHIWADCRTSANEFPK